MKHVINALAALGGVLLLLALSAPAVADEPISYTGPITLDTGQTTNGKILVSPTNPLPVTSAGSGATASQVQGNVAAGGADSGNPVKVGGVHNTTLPTLSNGHRGDLQLSARGALLTTGMQAVVSVSPTVSTTTYATGDAVGSLLTFSNAFLSSGGSGLLQRVALQFKSNQTTPMDLLLFDANPSGTTVTDNAAVAVSVADFGKLIGVVHVTDCTSAGTPSICQANGLAMAVKATSGTSLFGILVSRGTPTLASTSDVQVQLQLIQD